MACLKSRFAYLNAAPFLAFAHRGGASQWPENSMPAFQGAVDLGYRYIETDVHATRDGVLLAFHDEHLDRVTDRNGLIAELDYAEVAKARIDGLEPIPRFEELLATWPDIHFNVDPKSDGAVDPLIGAVRDMNAIDRVCITSFSSRRTAAARAALGPDLCTGLGPTGTFRLRLSSLSGPARSLWGGFVEGCAQLPTHQWGIRLIDRALIDRAHEMGLQVHVWTIDDRAEMERLIDLGVDGLMTDEPALLRTILESQGALALTARHGGANWFPATIRGRMSPPSRILC